MLLKVTLSDWKRILRDTGQIIYYSSAIHLVPILIALFYAEKIFNSIAFIIVTITSLFIGIILKKIKTKQKTNTKTALITVVITWILFTGISAIAFMLIKNFTFIDGFFEVMSALTTTGLSIVPKIMILDKSLVFYRSILSWIGGLGIIILALIGLTSRHTKQSKLFVAEGHEEKIKSNFKHTALELWRIYLILTLFGIILLLLSGMNLFQATNYSMSAISTTGLQAQQPYNAINNLWTDISLIIIMLLGAISFAVHYLFIKKRQLNAYFKELETRTLILLSVIFSLIIIPKLMVFYRSNAIIISFFHVISAQTGGGFQSITNTEMILLPGFAFFVLMFAMFIGGSSGSTAGGIKISRMIIFLKSLYWKSKKMMLGKHVFFSRKLEGRKISEEESNAVNLFIITYLIMIVIGSMVLVFNGNSISQSLFEVVSAQGNSGLTTGITKMTMSLTSKIMLIINMFIGRLELIPITLLLGMQFIKRKNKFKKK